MITRRNLMKGAGAAGFIAGAAGVPMPRSPRMKASKSAMSAEGYPARLQPARNLPHRPGRPLLVPCGQAQVLSDPQRRPGRQAPRGARPSALSAGAPPLHHQGERLRHAYDSHLRSRRPLHQFGRGLRREAEPACRIQEDRGSRHGEEARIFRPVLGSRIRFHPVGPLPDQS
jgi:hypothetical protein